MKAQHIATIALAGIVMSIGTVGIATAEYELIRTRGQAVASLFDRPQARLDRDATMVASRFDFKTYDDDAMNPELASMLTSEIDAQECPKAPEIAITSVQAKPVAPVAPLAKVAAPVKPVRRTVRKVRPVLAAPTAPATPAVVAAPRLASLPNIPRTAIQTYSTAPGFKMSVDENGGRITLSGLPQAAGQRVFVFGDSKKMEAEMAKLDKAKPIRLQGPRPGDFPRFRETMKFYGEAKGFPKATGVWKAIPGITVETAKEIRDAVKEAAKCQKDAETHALQIEVNTDEDSD